MRGRTVAKRKVRLAKRSVTSVKLRFDRQAVCRPARRRGTRHDQAAARSRRRRPQVHRSADADAARSAAGAPSRPRQGRPRRPAHAAGPRAAGSAGWATEGPYDDLELTVSGGQMQITKAPVVPVSCFEMGGWYRSAISFELFSAPGPWTIGTDGARRRAGHRRQPAGQQRRADDQLQGDRHEASSPTGSRVRSACRSPTPSTTSPPTASPSSTAPAPSPSRRCRPAECALELAFERGVRVSRWCCCMASGVAGRSSSRCSICSRASSRSGRWTCRASARRRRPPAALVDRHADRRGGGLDADEGP